MRVPSARLDANKTIFVGALHGMLTAEGLAKVMNDLFDNVVYSGIDTDKYKYPIGNFCLVIASKNVKTFRNIGEMLRMSCCCDLRRART